MSPDPVQAQAGPRASEGPPAPRASADDDAALVDRLRRGDEEAFAQVVRAWSPMMLRVARRYLSTEASCEEVVQETWLAVIHGLHAFEGRSTLRTWVMSILSNLAKTRGARESRCLPVPGWGPDVEDGSTVDPRRFRGPGDPYPHHWTPVGRPTAWEPGPEQAAVAAETRRLLGEALAGLPERQRAVVTLRDVHGLDADEVCSLLGLSGPNQRVVLHRGRARLRTVLESYYRAREEESS